MSDTALSEQVRIFALERLASCEDTQCYTVGQELLAVSDLLREYPKLLSALTLSTRSVEDKHALLRSCICVRTHQTHDSALAHEDNNQLTAGFDKHVSLSDGVDSLTYDIVAYMTTLQWQDSENYVSTCEDTGLAIIFQTAHRHNRMEKIQYDLFVYDQMLRTHKELRHALSNPSRSVEDRLTLLRAVFGEVTDPIALLIVTRILSHCDRGRLLAVLRHVRQQAAYAQGKELAVVHSAVALTDIQKTRLAQVLEKISGRPVTIDMEIDPEVIGGMRIRLGADLYEGTLAASLRQVRERLAG